MQHIFCILCVMHRSGDTQYKSLLLDLKHMKLALNFGHNVPSHSVSQTICGGWLHLTLFPSGAIVGSIYTHYQGTGNVQHALNLGHNMQSQSVSQTSRGGGLYLTLLKSRALLKHITEHALLYTNIKWAHITNIFSTDISAVFIVWSIFSSQPNVKQC